MSSYAGNEWQLSLSAVYPRQAIYGFQLAPDERRFSFVQQRDKRVEEIAVRGHRKINVVRLADICLLPSTGGYPQPITESGDCSRPAVWSPTGKWLVLERGGGLQIMPASGGQAKTIYKGNLFRPRRAKGDAYLAYPRWSPDGEYVVFATRDEPQTALRLVSGDGRLQRELFSMEGYIIGWDWSADGRRILLVTRSEDGWVGDVRLLDVENGESRILWTEDNYEYQKPVAIWGADGEHIIFRSNRSGWAKLWITAVGNGDARPLTEGHWDDYAFRLSPDGQQIVYASRAEQGGSGDDLWIVSLSGQDPTRLTRQPGVNVPLAWSKDELIYYWHSSPVEPGDLWAISIYGGEPERLTWSTPLDVERRLRAPEEVLITNDDGTRFSALVYLPVYYQEGDRYPAIVWIRGGPTLISRFDYTPFYNWLSNRGYIVINPNYRGSIGYGIEHMAAVSGEGLGQNDLSDVLAAGQYAKTLPNVDLRRGIGVGGYSWGGYLTLMAVTQAPEVFSCGTAGGVISDWRIQQAGTEVRYYDRWLLGGWTYHQEKRARDRSPVSYVDRIQVPLLVFQGEEDRDTPFSQLEPFVKKAHQVGAELEFISYPAEGHFNKKPENQQDILDRMEEFYRRHLQPWNMGDNPCAGQVQL